MVLHCLGPRVSDWLSENLSPPARLTNLVTMQETGGSEGGTGDMQELQWGFAGRGSRGPEKEGVWLKVTVN